MTVNLSGKLIVFTGSLRTMTRKEANHLVLSLKGRVANHISKDTDILVVGNYSKNLFDEEPLTNKERLAKEYQLDGGSIAIINEKKFLAYALESLEKKIIL